MHYSRLPWAAISSTQLVQDVLPNSRPRKKLGWWVRPVPGPAGRESVFKHLGGRRGLCVAQLGRVATFLFFQPQPWAPVCVGDSLVHLQPRGLLRLELEESQGLGLSQQEGLLATPRSGLSL